MPRAALLTVLLAASCTTGGLPAVIDARDVAAQTGAPHLRRVSDAGTVIIPSRGATIEPLSDGVASPGELLVLEGSGFGRLPTVRVGGRPAEVLARTRGDGIVVRVPNGVRAGAIEIEVSNSAGTTHIAYALRRLAAVLAGDKLRFVTVDRAVTAVQGEIPASSARAVRIDSTGGVALVLRDTGAASEVLVVDLDRAMPELLGGVAIPYRGVALAAAQAAPRVVVVGEESLSLLDTASLRRPVLYDAAPLPKEVRGVRRAALSPDGRWLALLLGGNRVAALDVTKPAPRLLSIVDALPSERESLTRDLAFSADGRTVWLVSGASEATYPQVIPTRVTALRLVEGVAAAIPGTAPERSLAVWKTQTVAGAGAPLAMALGPPPDAGGSAIRSAPESATVYIAAAKASLYDLKSGPIDLARLRRSFGADAGQIARGQLGGGGGPVLSTPQLLTTISLPAGEDRALGLALAVGDAVSLGVAAVPLDGHGAPTFTPMFPLETPRVHPPFTWGDIAVQP